MRNKRLKFVLIVAVTMAIALLAAPPRTLTYQGKLTDDSGIAITGSVDLTFSIFNVVSGGTALWTETHSSVPITNGLFDVILGEITSMATLDYDEQYWMELKVGTETLSPREKMAAVPYAHRVVYADTAVYFSGSIPSGAYVAFPDSTPRTGWTFTGCHGPGAGDRWRIRASMSGARYEGAAASVDGKIYVIGGDYCKDLNEEYDPATDSWTTKASMPTGRHALVAVALDEKIYAIGGREDGADSRRNEMYDPVTDTWTTKANMIWDLQFPGAATANGKIYVIGGQSSTLVRRYNSEYDPSTNSWSLKADLSFARTKGAAASVGNKVYYIGGGTVATGHGSPGSWNQEYDPATDSWTTKASMPSARRYLTATALNGKIYAMGGDNYFNSDLDEETANEEYDPATNTWTKRSTLPLPVERAMAAEAGGKIYLIGGVGAAAVSKNYEYKPAGLYFYWFQKD